MLVSHRHHAPFGDVRLELDRVLTPTWIARRVRLSGVTQDEHLTKGLGRGTASERYRLKIMLSGRLEATVGERSFDLGPGDFLLMPRIAECLTRGGDDETLELDWEPGAAIANGAVPLVEQGRLGAATAVAVKQMTDALRAERSVTVLPSSSREDGPCFARTMPVALAALAAEGLPLEPRGATLDLQAHDADEQRLLDAIDETLMRLGEGPAAVELETRLGWSRRTVSRRTALLHARYGLSGVGSRHWRAVRDFYRVLVGTIVASSPLVSTKLLARVLGYASPHALCHAFANAGLPSPAAVGRAARRGGAAS